MEMETIKLGTLDPMELFKSWYAEANSTAGNLQPEVMTLATMGKEGCPSARTVLLRGLDYSGFKMYWNKHSQKSRELESNNQASLVFVWSYQTPIGSLGFRQVRVQGHVEGLPQSDIDAYFDSEPLLAKIRATVQNQSRVITDEEREEIRQKCDDLWEQVRDNNLQLKCPPGYGGFILKPIMIEFYQGLRDTINDRIRFRKGNVESDCERETTLHAGNSWVYERLEC